MTAVAYEASLASGYEALASGNWEEARDAFSRAVDATDSSDALDGLGRALWWLRDVRGAVVHRERAYAGFRRDGQLARAARIALLAVSRASTRLRERSRCERLAQLGLSGSCATSRRARSRGGCRSPARSGRAIRTSQRDSPGRRSIVAATAGDTDLELRALAQLGLAEVSAGRVDDGLARLDEAMAAATAESRRAWRRSRMSAARSCSRATSRVTPSDRSSGAPYCEEFVRKYDPVTLLAFCRTCCADVFAANGRIDAAEGELLAAIRELTDAGHRSRCGHPAARLAEIRVLQGRFDEAEQLLDGFEDEPEAVAAAASLRFARGEPAAAEELLNRRLDEVGRSSLLAAPLYGQLVEASLAAGRLDDARAAAAWLARIAEESGLERVEALALLARARVAAATGEPDAVELLRGAVERACGARMAPRHCPHPP